MIGMWMLPALLAGLPYDIPPLLVVRNYAATGLFSMTDALGRFLAPSTLVPLAVPSAIGNRVSIWLFASLVQFVPFRALLEWTALTAIVFSLVLIPWWLTVKKLFDARIAWLSLVTVSLMPMYWREAVWLNHYQFALFFLFCGFASFVWLRERSLLGALALSGVFLGLAAGAKDAFLVALPWYGFLIVWAFWGNRKRAAAMVSVFVCSAALIYFLPYLGDIRTYGYPVNQNLARLWPGAKEVREDFYLHLYPDPYTYFFDRERFDKELLLRLPMMSSIERVQTEKILINFDVGTPDVLRRIANGLWLFLGQIPSFFQQDTVGGVVLWLFILPGAMALIATQRFLAISLIGLILFTEVIIRFVFHYQRDHLMDTGWALALFAAVGIAAVADGLAVAWKRASSGMLTFLIISVLALALVQTNRVRFARLYSRTLVPDTVAAAEILRQTPDKSAVIALPLGPNLLEQLAVLSDRSVVLFAPETVERLLDERQLKEVFAQYGVTHVMRYDTELMRRMQRTVPSLTLLEDQPVGPVSPPVTPSLRFLLHLIR